jgi:hypothetical protein
VDIEATQGDGPPDDVEAFAGARAASLRRMFPANPSRPAAPQVIKALPSVLSPAPPAPRRRRWPLVAAAGVLVAAGAGGVVVALRSGGGVTDRPSSPATGPGTAVALAPVASVSPGPEPGPASSAPRRSAGAAVAPSGKTRTRTTAPDATATATTAATPEDTTETTVAKSSGPISAYGACTSGSTATFTATFTVSYDFRHVFINTDDDSGTGYRVPSVSGGLGADYMIENGVLYRSTARSWSWSQVRGVDPLAAQSGGSYTWRVALSDLDSPDDLSVAFNGSGGSAEAYTPIVDAGSC